MKRKLQGLGVALVTPFDKKLRVDLDGLAKLLEATAAGGVDYWVVQGSTGEAATIDPAEKKEILQYVQAHNPHQLPIVYGMGGNNTQELVRQIEQMDFHGIDAILSVSPYYNRPSQAGIYEHYKCLAAASPVPIILYNVPARTGSMVAPETVIRLSELPNIIGIKEASGDLLACMEITKNKPADFLLISGDDGMTIPIMALGGVGVISVLANALPQQMRGIVQAMQHKNHAKAQQYQFEVLELQKLILRGGNPVVIKQILAILGICEPYVRLPLVPLDATFLANLQQAMQPWLSYRSYTDPR
jgi:4-hydroxy-tetrahydrodipicolinate synthase